jgi:RNA recognition motif-containing protein
VDINKAIEQDELPPEEVVLKKHRKLYFRGVRSTTTEPELHDYFSAFGKVVKVYLIFSPRTGRSRSFGYVEFETLEAANLAITHKSHKLAGKKFSLEKLKDVKSSDQPCEPQSSAGYEEPRSTQVLGSSLGDFKEREPTCNFVPLRLEPQNQPHVITDKKFDEGCLEDYLSHSLTYTTINHSSRTTIQQACRGMPQSAPAASRMSEYYQHIKSLNATVLHSDTANYRLNKESVAAHRSRVANSRLSPQKCPADPPRLHL